jgi:hypothetical protein
MRMVTSIVLALSLSSVLAGCAADTGDSVEEGASAAIVGEIDRANFTEVNAIIARAEQAEALNRVLAQNGARLVGRGPSSRFAGLSQRELDGEVFDPNEHSDTVYGISCDVGVATAAMDC